MKPAPHKAEKHPAIHLVALDLDGTLLTSRKTITARTHRALRRVLARGVKVVLATARPPRSVRTYYEALQLGTPQINYNGALIWDEPGKRILHHEPLAPAQAKAVIDFARRRYPEILVSVEILDKWYTDHYADTPEYATETAKKFLPDFVGPLAAFLRVPATKVMLLGKPEWIEDLEERIGRKFAGTVGHTRSDPHLLQVLAPRVSKGRALARVAQHLGVGAGHIMAVGDAPNDHDMLEFAAVGVVVGNGWEQTKGLGKPVVPSNDEDGVAVALERWVLGNDHAGMSQRT